MKAVDSGLDATFLALAEQLGRRPFLKRLSAATLGIAAALTFPGAAQAILPPKCSNNYGRCGGCLCCGKYGGCSATKPCTDSPWPCYGSTAGWSRCCNNYWLYQWIDCCNFRTDSGSCCGCDVGDPTTSCTSCNGTCPPGGCQVYCSPSRCYCCTYRVITGNVC